LRSITFDPLLAATFDPLLAATLDASGSAAACLAAVRMASWKADVRSALPAGDAVGVGRGFIQHLSASRGRLLTTFRVAGRMVIARLQDLARHVGEISR
jgi:hypothetical protein